MIVTVDELQEHLRIQYTDEDEYLEKLLIQAESAAEDYCRVTFDPYLDEDGNELDPPEPARTAIMLLASFYYENRDMHDPAEYKATRLAFNSLLYPYRVPEKMF